MEYTIDGVDLTLRESDYIGKLIEIATKEDKYKAWLAEVMTMVRGCLVRGEIDCSELKFTDLTISSRVVPISDLVQLSAVLARKGDKNILAKYEEIVEVENLKISNKMEMKVQYNYAKEISSNEAMEHFIYYVRGGKISIYSEIPAIILTINSTLDRQLKIVALIDSLLRSESGESRDEYLDFQLNYALSGVVGQFDSKELTGEAGMMDLINSSRALAQRMYAGYAAPFYGKLDDDEWIDAVDLRLALIAKYLVNNTELHEENVKITVSYRDVVQILASTLVSTNVRQSIAAGATRQLYYLNNMIEMGKKQEVKEVKVIDDGGYLAKYRGCKKLLSDTIDNKLEVTEERDQLQIEIERLKLDNERLVDALIEEEEVEDAEVTTIYTRQITFLSKNSDVGEELARIYPNIRYIEIKNDRFDISNLDDTDLVVFDKLRAMHSTYFRLQKGLRGKDVPMIITSHTNIEILAQKIANALERVE